MQRDAACLGWLASATGEGKFSVPTSHRQNLPQVIEYSYTSAVTFSQNKVYVQHTYTYSVCVAFIATDSKHQSSFNFFLPCYCVKGGSFLHFAGSQEGSDLPKATGGGSNGAGRNPLPASPRLVDSGKYEKREKLI